MPELPDVVVYIEALQTRLVGRRLERIHLLSPFILRSVEPAIDAVHSGIVQNVLRVGKRIVLVFNAPAPKDSAHGLTPSHRPALSAPGSGQPTDDDLYLVLHLMIAGRLRWRTPEQKPGVAPRLIGASLVFEHGTLLFTEASSTKRASMQLVRGAAALQALDPGGIEPLEASHDAFRTALTHDNRTLKRALTDPHLVSGIGNAYSDEILHAARLSPLKLTGSLSAEELDRLYRATRDTLSTWIGRLRDQARGAFPEKVTAFRTDMAVHGRYKLPCPVCSAPVQRIVYAAHECNYCAKCQTGGRVLADRSLSRLLKDDWPDRLEE